jgi:MFS transporter, Spinster family, sphingosine-1-phosphate transporter
VTAAPLGVKGGGVSGGGNHARAYFGLVVLSLINLVNYLDRYIIAGVLPKIEQDFGLSHTEAGMLGFIFMASYMVVSPLGGYLGDRMPRRFLVAASVFLWSLATLGSGLAGTFVMLLWARAIIGVGEAGYGTVAPALISDLFTRDRRTLMLSFFYVALPLGAAAGYGVGGYFASVHTWHGAFFAGGIPGLFLAALALMLPEPARGATELEPRAQEKIPFRVGLAALAKKGAFWFNTVGQTLMTFSIGGLAYWMPSFLERERGIAADKTGLLFGAVTAVAGILGTLAGGYLGDRWERKVPGGLLLVSGIGLVLASPFMVAAANVGAVPLIFGAIFVAQFLIFFNTGPLNAALCNCVEPGFRAFAMGLNVLFIHLLGDAVSPPIIGFIAQHSSLGLAIELNAIPVFLGGAILLIGARNLSRG